MAMTLHECPAILLIEGNTTGVMADLVVNKYKIFPSMEAAMKASEDEPSKTFKKMFGIFCLERGVTIGGKHMDEYMPQFINFFKENLL